MRKLGKVRVEKVLAQSTNPRDQLFTKLDFHADVDINVKHFHPCLQCQLADLSS